MSKTKAPPAKQAILEILKVEPQASVAQIAVSVGVGRSTAGKLLAQLESNGEVHRTEGGRDGKRRLPDLWSLTAQQPPANDANAKPASSMDSTEPTASGESDAQARAADRNSAKPKAEAAGRPVGPREGSTMWAAIEVLREKGEPMRAAEIYAEIKRRNLAPGLKGKTPEATVAAQLAVHVKRGLYVERPEPGKFQLKDEVEKEPGSDATEAP